MKLIKTIGEIKNIVWVDYVKNDVLCTAFSYAGYSRAIDEKTGFGIRDCLSLPGLGWKYFNSFRTEEHEPTYTYNDKHMKYFVRQSTKEVKFVLSVSIINQNFVMLF